MDIEVRVDQRRLGLHDNTRINTHTELPFPHTHVNHAQDDINSLLNNKILPPARANFLEEWREAQREADISEYAFKKGLNYYDQ